MLPTCGVISFLLLTCVTNSQSQVPIYHNQLAEAVHIVKSVQGGAAKLPCDVTPSFPGDKAYIVIWYKEDQNGKLSPIYTFDSRDTILLGQGKHWSAELGLGDRADFRFQEEPAKLAIDSVLYSDAGVYQCRVDFKQSPTRNSRVNLTVIIPPRKLSILDENGVQVANYVLGPYNEGFSINLTCIATGGFPTPKVTWWQENALLDDSCEDLSENSVRNILHMEKLQRRHLGTVLTCQASNNDLIAPISTSMRLDLNLQPLSVKIEGENKPLSAGKLYQFKCEVVGSNPSPKISWWRGRNRMDDVEETRSKDGNITTSLVTFIPTLEDEGKYITCSAKQPLIRDSTLESRWKLSILHRPVVSLGLGNLVKSTKLREGDDAYFDCKIKSNPWVYKISWRYNGKTLFSNTSEGIIISNQSLVLQEVDRNSGGSYTCVGSNQEGDGESNSIELEIQFAPVCRSRQVVTYELSVHQTATINCDLDASPKATDFVWIFNNTGNSDNPARVNRTTGTISYSPQSESNYGTLFCKGINGIGEQDEPCIFQIVRAAKPGPLSNCKLINQTYYSIIVDCAQNMNQDFNQTFVSEVYSLPTQRLLKNLSAMGPVFAINELTPGSDIQINLYIITEHGRSKATSLNASIPIWENPAEVLLPPENCSVASQTRSHLRIKCQAPKIRGRKSLTYLLQVYDANSRTLVGTATSQSPEAITVTALPRDYQDLLLFVRGVDENSVTSNATILFAPAFGQAARLTHRASSPVKFHITPALAITMSVVAIVVVIFVVLLAASRLCNGRRHDCKEYDEDGLSRIRSNDSIVDDKNEMRSKSSNIEEDKNPDIIPTDEKAIFEHLSSETYLNLQDTDDISTSYVTSPDFSNLKKQPKSRQMEFPDRDLSYTEAILQRSSGYYPLRLERLPVYKSEKFRYATKPVPGAARLQPEQSDATLQPLILHRDRIPVMILPRQQLTVTQL